MTGLYIFALRNWTMQGRKNSVTGRFNGFLVGRVQFLSMEYFDDTICRSVLSWTRFKEPTLMVERVLHYYP
jgi:hypothetical protein